LGSGQDGRESIHGRLTIMHRGNMHRAAYQNAPAPPTADIQK
jgi:hypothetical protein